MRKQHVALVLVFLLLGMPLSNAFNTGNTHVIPLEEETTFFSSGNTTDWAILMTRNSAAPGGPNNENWVKITDVIGTFSATSNVVGNTSGAYYSLQTTPDTQVFVNDAFGRGLLHRGPSILVGIE